jgi:peptidylprolyl isomerase
MDRRVIGLLVGGGILAVVVVVVLLARGGGSGGGTTSVAETGSKPSVEVPKGPPPTNLVVKDLKTGNGAEAKSGNQVSVQYVGVLYSDGKQFDSSWDRGQPYSFPLGGGRVIPGWDQGVAGMKVGGRRELIVPPNLGYGARGRPPTIPANATLVFVIDLLSVG